VPSTANFTHFFGSASTIGTRIANGGTGKNEASITETTSIAASACFVRESASTRR
jgi:hypothetical protein